MSDKTSRKLKVETLADVTQAQRELLRHLGCDLGPSISWPHALVFAASSTSEQEQELRNLPYVFNVGPMETDS